MFGSVDYFTNSFKECIMNNLTIEKPNTMMAHYSLLTKDIYNRSETPEEKERFQRNLDTAYKRIKTTMIGMEEEQDGS